MFFTKIRLGLFERDLAHRYGVSEATVSDVIDMGKLSLIHARKPASMGFQG